MFRSGSIQLDEDELEWRFVRASGPGGQNVNKVSSAVQLRFDLARSASLPSEVKQRLMRLAGHRLTERGVIVIDARRFRSQARNRKDALERLLELIRRAEIRPQKRIATRPTAASRERRLRAKQVTARKKLQRGPVRGAE